MNRRRSLSPIAGRQLERAAVIAAAVVLLMAALVGCGGSGSSSTSSTVAKVSPADISRAADTSSAQSGYRTVMSMRESLPGVGQISMNGSGSFGNQHGSMNLAIKVPGVAAVALGPQLQVSMVVDNGVLYMRLPTALTSKLPGVKPWLKLDLRHAGGSTAGLSSLIGSSRQLTDPGQYFQYLHSMAAGSLRNLGAATINGVQTTHYHGEISAAQLSRAAMAAKQPAIAQAEEQLSKTIAGGRIPVDVYVDSSGLVRRIAIYEPLSLNGKSAYAAIKVDFPQYGAQPAPAVPPADQVTNFASLAGAVP